MVTEDKDIYVKIANLIKDNDVVLFMKGTAEKPMCGFSGTVVNILKQYNLPFKDVNILEDLEMREAIKEFTDWPTIPQLYIKGEFIGGCDIVREIYQTGEFEKLLHTSNLLP